MSAIKKPAIDRDWTPELLDRKRLSRDFSALLDRLSAQLVTRLSDQPAADGSGNLDEETGRLQASVARIGQIVAGLAAVPPEDLPADAAGFGSRVLVKNLATGAVQEYTLMIGSLLDVAANQVSLVSPIGRALLGRKVGEDVLTVTPQGRTRLRILRVQSLPDLLEAWTAADAPDAVESLV